MSKIRLVAMVIAIGSCFVLFYLLGKITVYTDSSYSSYEFELRKAFSGRRSFVIAGFATPEHCNDMLINVRIADEACDRHPYLEGCTFRQERVTYECGSKQ